MEDVLEFLKIGEIYDEYGRGYALDDFLKDVVYNKERGLKVPPEDEYTYYSEGFPFSYYDFC